MAERTILKKLMAGVLGSCVVLGAALAAAPESPGEILARAKKAAGGDAWNEVRSSHSRVKLATGGLTGTAESWDDVRTGRYLDRYELGPVAEAQGFDGEVVWSQDTSKQVRTEEGGDEREAAANEAYRRSLAYWFPERWPASFERSPDQEEGGPALPGRADHAEGRKALRHLDRRRHGAVRPNR